MGDRFFEQDKNYLLKEAQEVAKEGLLEQTVISVRNQFMRIDNPMGLEDDFVRSILATETFDTNLLHDFYDAIAAIYRYLHGDNQLEFLWDGSTHREYYEKKWSETYLTWIIELSGIKAFRRVILKGCILEQNQQHLMLKPHLFRSLSYKFGLRLNKRKELEKAA